MASVAGLLAVCVILSSLGPSEECPCSVTVTETSEKLNCKRLELKTVPPDCPSATITEIDLNDNMLTELHPHQFTNFSKVKRIDLAYNEISLINETAFYGLRNLLVIDLRGNKLTDFPQLATKSVTILTLAYNGISQLQQSHFDGLTELLTLDLKDNEISSIDDYTFVDACRLEFLSLRDNPLKRVEKEGFVGTALTTLDIRNTLLQYLPTAGLQGLQVLRATDVPSLKSFPSHSSLPNIEQLRLSYHSHCCLYEGKQDRTEQGFLPTCGPTETTEQETDLSGHRSAAANITRKCPLPKPTCYTPVKATHFPRCRTHPQSIGIGGGRMHHIPSCDELKNATATPPLVTVPAIIDPNNNFTPVYFQPIICSPEPDDFNSCDDVMGNWLLRILVWLVIVINISGNTTVIVVFLANYKRFNAIKLLLTNMAFADLGMSVYLITLASVDAATFGEYADHAIDWKTGGGCEAIGFISVFSSILSLYSLTALTIERWYTIHFAMYGRKMGFKHALIIVAIGWVYAIVMASLPLAGVSSYETTAICLPFDLSNGGQAYIIFGLLMNLLAFCIIAGVYTFLFYSITSHGPVSVAGGRDVNILLKMLLLVLVDFCCWMPIIVMGITSAADREKVNISLLAAKYIMIFIYPLNSCANPFLYAIFTKPFKRDFFEFWYRFGYFEEQYYRYSRPKSTRRTTKSSRVSTQRGGQSQASVRTNMSLVAVAANSPKTEMSILSPDTEISVASYGVVSSSDNGFVSESKPALKSVNFEDTVKETSFVEERNLAAPQGVDRDRSPEPLMDDGESPPGTTI